MGLPRFEVFYHSIDRPREVIVRLLSSEDFHVAPGTLLGGAAIDPILSQPRALDADGQPRRDLFVFRFIGPVVPKDLSAGAVLLLEVPNQRCPNCSSSWSEPALQQTELEQLSDLLNRGDRIAFVRVLRELTGLSLESAKAVLVHLDSPPGCCHRCGGRLRPEFSVRCVRCAALNYPWHMQGVVVANTAQ